MPEFDTFLLAALFYNIGRCKRRATGEEGSLEGIACRWLREEGLDAIAQGIERWRELLDEAAQLAVRGEPAPEEDFSHPLVSLFATISLDGRGGQDRRWFYDPARSPYPTRDLALSRNTYRSLWEAFVADLNRVKTHLTPDLVLSLLGQYTAFIPYAPSSPDSPLADISLFDHIKAMTALASCLYLSLKQEHHEVDLTKPEVIQAVRDRVASRYLLVGGDFPSIQDFVYRISSKGALKGLRGRSFFLELLTHHVVAELIQPFRLSQANVLLAGGGRLDVLLPNTAKAKEHVETVRRRINAYLRRVQEAKLSLVLEWQELNGTDLITPPSPDQGLDMQWSKLLGKIESRKLHRASEALGEDSLGEACRWCGRRGQEIVSAEECQRWGIDGPVCTFCFLLLPKEPKVPKASLVTFRGFDRTNECEWCHQAGVRREIQVGEERLFGCDNPACLGAVNADHVDECEVCHRRTILAPLPPPKPEEAVGQPAPVMACAFCRNLYHVGEHLSFLTEILRSPKEPQEPQKVFLQIEDVYYYFPLPDHVPSWHQRLLENSETEIWIVNESSPTEWRFPAKTACLLLGVYPGPGIPRTAVPLEFEALAEGLGAKRIGVLRMDVDDLGDIFQQVSGNLARASALARLVTAFFTVHLNQLCEGKGLSKPQTQVMARGSAPRRVVVVYSGGDDLFLVGHWHDVAELAFDISNAFRAYTCENPAFGLSGGFLVQHHDFPLYQLAQMANKAEKEAKEQTVPLLGGGEWRKKALAPFFPSRIYYEGEEEKKQIQPAFKWTEGTGAVPPIPTAQAFLAFVRKLVEAIGQQDEKGLRLKEGIPRGFLFNLVKVVEDRGRRGKLSLPRLAYALSRVPALPDEIREALYRLDTLAYLDPALTWIELLSRREGR